MTRKEELEKLAADLSGGHYECEDAWYSCPLAPEGCTDDGKGSSCTCGATQRQEAIFQVLQQVEREVLERVDTYYSHQIHDDIDDYPDRFLKWVRAQQKELG